MIPAPNVISYSLSVSLDLLVFLLNFRAPLASRVAPSVEVWLARKASPAIRSVSVGPSFPEVEGSSMRSLPDLSVLKWDAS